MAKKPKPEEPGPSKAYLVSFGDTMTSLLAFFIVLVSLAEDQTGANLYTGTGSFVSSMSTMGLPGAFSNDTSSRAVTFAAPSPIYQIPSEDGSGDSNKGPDDVDDATIVMDREEDDRKRFINEVSRMLNVNEATSYDAEAAFDFFEKFESQAPWLPVSLQKPIANFFGLLRAGTHEMEITVWATTPNPTAMTRAVQQANDISNLVRRLAGMNPLQGRNVRAVGRPWPNPDDRRPVISFTVKRAFRPESAN